MPHMVYTSNRIENLMEMIGQNMGISLLMERPTRYALCPHVKIVPLEEKVESNVALVRLRSSTMTRAANQFWTFVRTMSAANSIIANPMVQ